MSSCLRGWQPWRRRRRRRSSVRCAPQRKRCVMRKQLQPTWPWRRSSWTRRCPGWCAIPCHACQDILAIPYCMRASATCEILCCFVTNLPRALGAMQTIPVPTGGGEPEGGAGAAAGPAGAVPPGRPAVRAPAIQRLPGGVPGRPAGAHPPPTTVFEDLKLTVEGKALRRTLPPAVCRYT